jgi:hypothetical protein
MSEKDTVKARVFAEQALELSQIEKLSCYSKFIKQCLLTTNAAYSKEYIQINDSLQKKSEK